MTQSIPQTLPEKQAVERAMAAIDTMATTWAMSFKLREGVKAMMALPDGEDRLVAFIKHSYGEGLYEGRTSHNDAALSAQPLVGVIPEGMALVPIEPTEAMEVFIHRQAWKNAVAAAPQPPAVQQDRGEATGDAETYLRGRYGAYRGHFAWRELEEAFNAGAAIGTPPQGVDHG